MKTPAAVENRPALAACTSGGVAKERWRKWTKRRRPADDSGVFTLALDEQTPAEISAATGMSQARCACTVSGLAKYAEFWESA